MILRQSAQIRRRVWGTLGLCLFLGCAKPPGVKPSQQSADGRTTAKATDQTPSSPIELQLADTYSKFENYSDKTVMVLTYHYDDGRTEPAKTVVTTRFTRPNKLKLTVASDDNQVSVVCDGKQLSARIIDPFTKDFDGQVVLREAPAKLSIRDFYKATELIDPITPGEMLSALLGAPTGLDMTAWGLLLQEGRLVELVNSTSFLTEVGLLSLPNSATSVKYRVVEVAAAEGKYRFWIEPNKGFLRRIEFPPSIHDLPPGLKRVELAADFQEIQLSVGNNDFRVDDDGQQVNHFVLPPLPPPTDLLGKKIEPLHFADLTDQTVVVDHRGKEMTVLTWFDNHPASRLVMEQLEQVRTRLARPQIRFSPISVDGNPEETLRSWGIDSAIWLDAHAVGRDVLGVEQAPTTVILGADNVVQYFEVGANPNIGNDVAAVLERLLGGQDVAKETMAVALQAKQAYKRLLALAKSGGEVWAEQLDTQIPPASKPRSLVVLPLWKNQQITEPGNMLIVPGKQRQVVVSDGWKELAMLDTDGNVSRRIKLKLPENEGITLLRAGKSESDRALFAAATRGGRSAFVFDFGGNPLMQYPRIPGNEAAIGDIALGDLDGDRRPELIVAWQGNTGVHGVSIEGKHLWTNRVAPGAVSVSLLPNSAAGEGHQSVLLANESGILHLIDEVGRTLRGVEMGQFGIHQVAVWPASARGFEALIAPDDFPSGLKNGTRCGFTQAADGAVSVIGANENWERVWDYVLPAGVYRHQLDFPQSITLPRVGPTWILPGPDGSLHFVSVDGKFNDFFYLGKHIRGVAGLNVDEKAIILIATDGEVNAIELTMP